MDLPSDDVRPEDTEAARMPKTNDAFKCKYCGKFFLGKEEFKVHKRAQHREEMSRTTSSPSLTSSQASTSKRRPRRSPSPPPALPTPPPAPPTPPVTRRPTRRTGPAEETEPATEPHKSRARRRDENASPKKSGPGKKSSKKGKANKKSMPLPIGKKRKVVDKDGTEKEEWFRNPKFKGA